MMLMLRRDKRHCEGQLVLVGSSGCKLWQWLGSKCRELSWDRLELVVLIVLIWMMRWRRLLRVV